MNTPILNENNIEKIREQIKRKKSDKPYIASSDLVSQIITDYDVFPYPRYFRGVYSSHCPVVAEREAGFRPRHDNCYKGKLPLEKDDKVNLCFQPACNTIFPCFSNINESYMKKQLVEDEINKNCNVQYR